MNYAAAQYSTPGGQKDIRDLMLSGRHDGHDIRVAALYMRDVLRVGTLKECTALVRAAISAGSGLTPADDPPIV